VAREAKISGATVSRVLSGRTDFAISEETRLKVLKAAEQLGYRPNPNARALMTRRSGLIGFWMCLQYSRYRSQVLDRMRTIMSPTELAMAVTDIDEEFQWGHSFARALRVPVEGILAFDASDSIDAFGNECDRSAPDMPFVSMGVYWTEAKSFVGVDLKFGAYEAMDHLLGSGRRRIAYVAPYDSRLLNEGVRYEGYVEKMADAGLETDCVSVLSVNSFDVQKALQDRFAKGNPPDALLCMNDDLAIAASSALNRMGVGIGSDIAILGFDGIEEAEHCACPITTVRQPIEEMCNLAFQFLKRQMDDPSAPLEQRILKPTLVIRESTQA
jgi:LacI family transcriptional regulator